MKGDNERLCVAELHLLLRIFRLVRGSNSGPLREQASAVSTELPGSYTKARMRLHVHRALDKREYLTIIRDNFR